MLVASLASVDRAVRVLDFGGGMGVAAANMRRGTAEQIPVEYLIVDNEASCKRGRRMFGECSSLGSMSVKFIEELPECGDVGPVDVVVLSSVLQFVEKYEELLARLAGFAPRFWLFTFVPAGDIPTFASAQLNVPGSVLPVWFFNLRELVEKIEALGYRLVFKSALDRVFDMSNFPLSHQLPRQCNLLFQRR
jgi:putative methyltransferase (TIGR04325 family)